MEVSVLPIAAGYLAKMTMRDHGIETQQVDCATRACSRCKAESMHSYRCRSCDLGIRAIVHGLEMNAAVKLLLAREPISEDYLKSRPPGRAPVL